MSAKIDSSTIIISFNYTVNYGSTLVSYEFDRTNENILKNIPKECEIDIDFENSRVIVPFHEK